VEKFCLRVESHGLIGLGPWLVGRPDFQVADKFELGRVEGKQLVPGDSGTEWEIDAKGILANGEGFVIVAATRPHV
jgi:hypothetical protein